MIHIHYVQITNVAYIYTINRPRASKVRPSGYIHVHVGRDQLMWDLSCVGLMCVCSHHSMACRNNTNKSLPSCMYFQHQICVPVDRTRSNVYLQTVLLQLNIKLTCHFHLLHGHQIHH